MLLVGGGLVCSALAPSSSLALLGGTLEDRVRGTAWVRQNMGRTVDEITELMPDVRKQLEITCREGDKQIPSSFNILVFHPHHDQTHRRVLLEMGKGKPEDEALSYNYAQLGGKNVYINARSWNEPDFTFGPPEGKLSQAAYRKLILLHECGHSCGFDHPKTKDAGEPGGVCDFMVQMSGSEGSWEKRGLECYPSTEGLIDELRGGRSRSIMGAGEMRKLQESDPEVSVMNLGRWGQPWRIPTAGNGNCMVEAAILALAPVGGGRWTEESAYKTKDMTKLRESLTLRDGLHFRQALSQRFDMIINTDENARKALEKAFGGERGLKAVQKKLRPPMKNGDVCEECPAEWLFDHTIQALQGLTGCELLFIDVARKRTFCRSAVKDQCVWRPFHEQGRDKVNITAVIRWEHGSHFTCFGIGKQATALQTCFRRDEPIINEIRSHMRCGIGDNIHNKELYLDHGCA